MHINWTKGKFGVDDGSGIILWLRSVFFPLLQDKRKLRNHAGFGKVNDERHTFAWLKIQEHNQLPHY